MHKINLKHEFCSFVLHCVDPGKCEKMPLKIISLDSMLADRCEYTILCF